MFKGKIFDEINSYAYEMRSHSFYGALQLPTDVIADSADATYKDGVLRVEVQKSKPALEKKKRVEIK